jgi:stage III sporulation protein AG
VDFKPVLKNKWLLVLGILGIFLLVFGSFWNHAGSGLVSTMTHGSSATTQDNGSKQLSMASSQSIDPTLTLENSYDQKLSDMLKQVNGIYNVSVMVTLDSTGNLQLANNQQQTTQSQSGSAQSTSQSTTVKTDIFTQRTSDGSSVPFVIERTSPKVKGVLVLVDAKDFFVAKSEIINAIAHVLDVPAYKISVEPQKSNS